VVVSAYWSKCLGPEDMHLMFYDNMNTETFIRFLERMRRKFGPVLMFLDNASWHKAKAVRHYVSECGDI